MKKIGYILLIAGFLATSYMCVDVSKTTYVSWIWHRNNMAHRQITPDEASNAIRDITLKTNGLVRQTIWPAIVMLIGGLMIGIKPKENGPNQPSDRTR
jgi:hypothetical protein